ncbi:MAG: nucleotidyl transferase AbiEii/AbiGii toxin family protein, partial [Candidatus Thermoplasmatota archaeon]|nr:nucleotidyl transferase AbiEii/AbiGii toxin family protein [Candidatus Thermoplasmatota archaeon]
DILQESNNTGFDPKKTLQEHLQKTILATLSRLNAFHSIVFQGGTALRLFYDNPRFSEDLDFVLHPPHTYFDLPEYMKKLSSSLQPQFPFLQTITTRVQKQENLLQRGVLFTTSDNPLQQVRIHIELAMVPSHQNTVKILSYPPIQPAIRVETPTEILADTLLALGCREYIKGRDLWDIYFLTTEKHLASPWDLTWKKTADYHTTPATVQRQLRSVKTQLEKNGENILSTELKRFLPPSMFTSYQDMFNDIITQIVHLIETPKAGD